jgi:tellurite resistance protein TerC
MSADLFPWVLLALIVGVMLALDLLVLHREAKPIPFKQAAAWSAVWISLALAFGAFVAVSRGGQAGGEYLAGYLIELSLSVDNVFVFALIFAAFAVPAAYQHRLLFWGILGAIVFRAAFITAGTAVLAAAHWVIYLLGVMLVVTGIRLARSRGHAVDPEKNPVLRVFRRVVPMTDGYRGPAFFIRENGRRIATPLLAVLVAIETTDIMFALDSIPAVFAVTTDPFIVFSSNLFAILGLRSLYFLLAGLLDRFVYLKVGLAALLVFAGAKILVGSVYHIPVGVSLAVIVGILATAIVASLVATHPRRAEIRAPLVRVASGVGLGLAALASFGLAVAIRDGQPWPAPILAATLVVGSAVALAGGILAVRRRAAGRPAFAAIRIGAGVLLGTAAMALLAGIALLRDLDAAWLALDIAILAAATVAVVLGLAGLRALHARSTLVRGWATAGAAFLLVLALFIALD